MSFQTVNDCLSTDINAALLYLFLVGGKMVSLPIAFSTGLNSELFFSCSTKAKKKYPTYHSVLSIFKEEEMGACLSQGH